MSGNFSAFLPKNLQGSAPPSSGGPLYMQLRQSLEAAIRAGQLVDGEALPPERDIAEYANISRVTVRKAVDDLVKAGLLVRRHGSGTFVVRPSERVQQSLSMLTSFTEDMARRGITTQSKWLERGGLYYPSPEEMMKLGVPRKPRLPARLGRLRMASDLPLAIERASLSSEILPDPDAVKGSLYAELSRNGFRPVRAVQRIAACNIKDPDARILGVKEGDAGLSIERISYLPSGRVVEFTKSLYRGDAYDFVAELTIPQP
ncbi:GntR family transcriptional regulator [Brucella intermedia 229E]|uniref:GntR family transcriptional regulator n=1 Tax=Brucella intermedia 229E TaxID=1337887 RepID=U4V3V4_9HYPH|nr:GntR family transcriptional regulator [Brucella intermedia 229E]